MCTATFILIAGIILIAAYDFTNGFHDASDMIATAVASNSISYKKAIFIATLFTFLGPWLGGLAVADTIGQFVTINPQQQLTAQIVVLAAISTAIVYNLITWLGGLPSSSSNSLVSGLIGATLFLLGNSHIHWGFHELLSFRITGFSKIIIGMFFSPLAGFLAGVGIIRVFIKFFSRLHIRTRPAFITAQYFTVSWLAFSHGTNDAQKGMGMMGMMLYASGLYNHFYVPWWVILVSATSITLGTLFGGWNIIKTVGYGLYRVKLLDSLADQLGSAMTILGSSLIGAPTSTTLVVTTTLVGVGAGQKPGHVHWKTVISMLWTWLLAIPICIVLGFMCAAALIHLLK